MLGHDQSTDFDLQSTFVVLEPHHVAIPVAVTRTIYEDLDRRFDHFKEEGMEEGKAIRIAIAKAKAWAERRWDESP
jgi:hypothetical protein